MVKRLLTTRSYLNLTWFLRFVYTGNAGHLMEKIEGENLLHRAFSVFLFNSKYELLLQVGTWFYPSQTSFRICMQLLQSGSSTPKVHHLSDVIINQSTPHQVVWFLKVDLQHFYRPEHGLLILLTLLGYSNSFRRVLYLYDCMNSKVSKRISRVSLGI